MRELALFAGAGGGILAGELLGDTTVCAVERDRAAASVLVRRQNEGHIQPFPIWDDVRTFDGRAWRGAAEVNAVHGSGTMSRTAAVARLPTLTARDYRSERRSAEGFSKRAAERRGHTLPATLDHEAGGQGGPLNPDWCWFMGFPIGWTASEPLETHRFHEWRQQHGKC